MAGVRGNPFSGMFSNTFQRNRQGQEGGSHQFQPPPIQQSQTNLSAGHQSGSGPVLNIHGSSEQHLLSQVQNMITEAIQGALSSNAVGRNKKRPKGSGSLERQLTFLAYNRGGDSIGGIRGRPKVPKVKRSRPTATTIPTAPLLPTSFTKKIVLLSHGDATATLKKPTKALLDFLRVSGLGENQFSFGLADTADDVLRKILQEKPILNTVIGGFEMLSLNKGKLHRILLHGERTSILWGTDLRDITLPIYFAPKKKEAKIFLRRPDSGYGVNCMVCSFMYDVNEIHTHRCMPPIDIDYGYSGGEVEVLHESSVDMIGEVLPDSFPSTSSAIVSNSSFDQQSNDTLIDTQFSTALEEWKSFMEERSQFNNVDDCNLITCLRDFECDAAIEALKDPKFMENLRHKLRIKYMNEMGVDGGALKLHFLCNIADYFERVLRNLSVLTEEDAVEFAYAAGVFMSILLEQCTMFLPFIWEFSFEKKNPDFIRGLNATGIYDILARNDSLKCLFREIPVTSELICTSLVRNTKTSRLIEREEQKNMNFFKKFIKEIEGGCCDRNLRDLYQFLTAADKVPANWETKPITVRFQLAIDDMPRPKVCTCGGFLTMGFVDDYETFKQHWIEALFETKRFDCA